MNLTQRNGTSHIDPAGKMWDEFDYTPGITTSYIIITHVSSYTVYRNGLNEVEVYADTRKYRSSI